MRRELHFPSFRCFTHKNLFYWQHHYRDLRRIYIEILKDIHK